MKPHLFFVLICFTLLLSCKKDKIEPAPADVYVAGIEINNAEREVAKIWKNGALYQILSDGGEWAVVNSVYVTQANDVYATGYGNPTITNSWSPFLWKNGVKSTLNVGDPDYRKNTATGVYAQSNDVYVCGIKQQTNSNSSMAMLWRNGTPTVLSSGSQRAFANDVFVEGSDVYVVGYEYNTSGNTVAKLWKNNTPVSLSTGGTDAIALAVYVHQGDVYVAGRELTPAGLGVAEMWKNGAPSTLGEGISSSSATDIQVNNNGDVFVSGNEGRSAAVWKNGVVTKLNDGFNFAVAEALFVHNDDVYAVGYEYVAGGNSIANARIWKNGIESDLQLENPSKVSVAYSIFIKQP